MKQSKMSNELTIMVAYFLLFYVEHLGNKVAGVTMTFFEKINMNMFYDLLKMFQIPCATIIIFRYFCHERKDEKCHVLP